MATGGERRELQGENGGQGEGWRGSLPLCQKINMKVHIGFPRSLRCWKDHVFHTTVLQKNPYSLRGGLQEGRLGFAPHTDGRRNAAQHRSDMRRGSFEQQRVVGHRPASTSRRQRSDGKFVINHTVILSCVWLKLCIELTIPKSWCGSYAVEKVLRMTVKNVHIENKKSHHLYANFAPSSSQKSSCSKCSRLTSKWFLKLHLGSHLHFRFWSLCDKPVSFLYPSLQPRV